MRSKLRKLVIWILALILIRVDTCAFAQVLAVLELPKALEVIDDEAFFGDSSLYKVNVPEGTVEIGNKAFANSALSKITLPSTLKTIADDAFEGCTDLEITAPFESMAYNWAVTMGISVKCETPATEFTVGILEDGTCEIINFIGNSTHVFIPEQISGRRVTSIKNNAFWLCSNLLSVNIPNSVTSIGAAAFAQCINLENITIPSTVSSIGRLAFSGCTALRSISFPENEAFTVFEDYGLRSCTSLNSIYLPRTITKFETNSLPDAITSYNWNELDLWVYADSITVKALEKYKNKCNYSNEICFRSPSNPDFVIVEKNANTDPSIIVYGYKGTNSNLTIPNSIDGINVSLFHSDYSTGFQSTRTNGNWAVVTHITIADGVNTNSWAIGGGKSEAGAFYHCVNLESIIYEGESKLHAYAFENCNKIQSVVLPSGIDSIPKYLLYNHTSLQSVTISSCSTIEEYAFYNTNLNTVTIPNGVTTIAEKAFAACHNLTSITIPSSVEAISDDAFYLSKKVTVTVCKNSYAHTYCIDNNIKFQLIS